MPAFFYSLRFRLLVLVLLSALPAIGLTWYSGTEQRRLASMAAQEDALRMARLAAGNNEALIAGARQLLTSLAQVPQIRQGDTVKCNAFLENFVQQFPDYASFSVATPDGEVYCASITSSAQVNIKDRDYFQKVLKEKSFAVGSYSIGRLSGKAVLPFAYPILNQAGDVQVIIVASLDLSWFNQIGSDVQLPPNSALLIVDNNGVILSRFPEAGKYVGQQLNEAPIIKTILAKKGEGITEAAGVDGIVRLYAYTPFQNYNIKAGYVAIGIPTNIAYAGVNQIVARNMIGLVLVTLLALVAAWLAGDAIILRRVNNLLHLTRRLAAGDLSARSENVGGRGEIRQLQTSFNEMAEKLEQREGQLRRAEARYRSLVEQLPAIIYTSPTGEKNRTEYISPQVKEVLGFSQEEWLADPEIWFKQIHPEDCQQVSEAITASRANGSPLLVEYRMYSRSSELLWMRDEAAQVQDQPGSPISWQGILQDITARKQAELSLQDYSQQLERSNRELQDFAYIASHDLQEPLRKIQAFGERLQIKYQELLGDEGKDYIRRMQNAASRMQSMINDLLAYSRVATKAQPFGLVNLNEVAAGVINDLETRTTESGGKIEVGNLPIIEAEPLQMRQLFQNLIANALKFHKPGEPPLVHVSVKDDSETRKAAWQNYPATQVQILFEDNGIGFDEKYLNRIFQPFQRLNSRVEYEGSGIGLAICRKIVERHGGSITAQSKPGSGSTFIVTLPTRQKGKGAA